MEKHMGQKKGGSICKMVPQPGGLGIFHKKLKKIKKYLKIKISKQYSSTYICRYSPMSQPNSESPRQSRVPLLNYLFWNRNKLQKYLNIGNWNSYYSTRICRYWPMSMPIFESQSRNLGLLFNFPIIWYLNAPTPPRNMIIMVLAGGRTQQLDARCRRPLLEYFVTSYYTLACIVN